MKFPARLRLERALIEDEIRFRACRRERQRDECLLVFGIRLLPREREDEPRGRLNDVERAAKMKGISVGRLHGYAVLRALRDIELKARHGEARGPPPLSKLVALNERGEHAFRRRGDVLFQMER